MLDTLHLPAGSVVDNQSGRPRLAREVPIVLYLDVDQPGGTVPYFTELGRGLRRKGYRVAAICSRHEAVAGMRAALHEAGVDVRTMEDSDPSLGGRLRRLRAFASVIQEFPGCVLALMMGYHYGGGPATLAGALAGAGAIVRADLQPPIPPVPTWDRIAVNFKDLPVDRIVVGAHENVEANVRLLARASSKMRVIHTGIDLNKYQPASAGSVRAELGFTPDQLVISMVARIAQDWQRKGFSKYLQMAAEVARQEPRAAFLIVGDGQSRGLVEQQARDLGLAERVTFAGWRQDLAAVLASTDVFVMPSLFEGGPTIVLEAMAMGRPVVATRVGMVPEVMLDGQTGRIVTPGDAHAMALAVGELLADAEQRRVLGERARAHAERHFSIDRMVDGYLEVFAEALARPRGLHRRSAVPKKRLAAGVVQ